MRTKKIILITAIILTSLSFYSMAQLSEAPPLAFSITPKASTSLPTSIIPGQTITAFYTVKDKTGGPFPKELYNYVKHLPKNVEQVTTDPDVPDLCGKKFKLQPYGSCTLELKITGTVSKDCAYENSDNPCLFVCMSDGFTCAGTEYPLNVTVGVVPMAGGQYDAENFVAYPMLARSANGTTWEYTIKQGESLPAQFANNGVIPGTSCTGNTCVAVGQYDTNSTTYPLIAVSTQGGANNTWQYAVSQSTGKSTLPKNFQLASFHSVSCDNTICVAGGQYTDINNNIYPMLAVSTKSGAMGSWTYVVDSTLSSLPSNYKTDGSFNTVSCSNNVCMAAGEYTSTSNRDYPLLIANINVSENGTWDYVVESQGKLPNDYAANGVFYSVSCFDNICAAAGQYDNNNGTFPLLIMNINIQDSSTPWKYRVYSSNTTLPCNQCNGSFNGLSCSDEFCVAGGNYINGNSFPMVAKIPANTSVEYVIDATHNLPANFDHQGSFFAVSCAGKICAAGGQYFANDGHIYPMLAESIQNADSGTWSYAVDKAGALPSDYYDGGSFYGVSCLQSICTAQGYYNSAEGAGIYYPMLGVNTKMNQVGSIWSYGISGNSLQSDYGLFCGTNTFVCY